MRPTVRTSRRRRPQHVRQERLKRVGCIARGASAIVRGCGFHEGCDSRPSGHVEPCDGWCTHQNACGGRNDRRRFAEIDRVALVRHCRGIRGGASRGGALTMIVRVLVGMPGEMDVCPVGMLGVVVRFRMGVRDRGSSKEELHEHENHGRTLHHSLSPTRKNTPWECNWAIWSEQSQSRGIARCWAWGEFEGGRASSRITGNRPKWPRGSRNSPINGLEPKSRRGR